MKTPRDILLNRHQAASPNLDAIRHGIVGGLNNKETKEQSANRVTLLLRCLNLIWSELIVPSRRIWAGLAAIWILIIAANISFRQQSPTISKNSAAGGMIAIREQQKLLNDLFADRSTSIDADKPKVFSPKPRTELAQTDIV